jgi:acetyl esterase/lipase
MRNSERIRSMRMRLLLPLAITIVLGTTAAGSAYAQLSPSAAFAAQLARQYRVMPDIVYQTASNFESKLDVYQFIDAPSPRQTLIYFHGGGWTQGAKEASTLMFSPYLEAGWNVINVEYRLARVALAPAAVEDGLCALRWTIHNAKQYNIDASRIVLSGNSAGGHLALTTGMIPASAGLDRRCPGPEELKVAAIVNWYGITDVADLLEGPNMKTYAVTWLGSLENRKEIARRLSPLTYVRPGLPPIITIQANNDPTVPYSHSVRLHEALEKAGVPNQLVTVQGNTHGNYKLSEYIRIYAAIEEFLGRYNLWKTAGL